MTAAAPAPRRPTGTEGFEAVLQRLKARPAAPGPPEPEGLREDHAGKQFRAEREQAGLADGGVLKAVIRPGEAGGPRPAAGDLVGLHYTVRDVRNPEAVLASTRREDGGPGPCAHFVVEKTAHRLPRGFEVALLSMERGERAAFTIQPAFGYAQPECAVPAPAGVAADTELEVDLELVECFPSTVARPTSEDGRVIKRVLEEGVSWEYPRPPYKLSLEFAVSAAGGAPLQDSGGPVEVVCGAGQLPEAIEEAVGAMVEGEEALVYCPAELVTASPLVEAVRGRAGEQVHVRLKLHRLFQVRDVWGDGRLIKTRTRDGTGTFPIDCPLEDCTVALRCKGWTADEASPFHDSWGRAEGPLEIPLGHGRVPEHLETCIRLMVPGEVSRLWWSAERNGGGEAILGAPIEGGCDVEWEVELVGFDRPRQMEEMAPHEVLQEVRAFKAAGNALFKEGRCALAKPKYEKALKYLKRGLHIETEELVLEAEELQLSCHLNVAACAHKLADYAEAVRQCDKALQIDPDHPKALFRRGQAYLMTSDFDLARRDMEALAGLDAGYAGDAAATLERIRRAEAAAKKKEKRQFGGFLG